MDGQKRNPLWNSESAVPDTRLRRPNPSTLSANLNCSIESIQSLTLSGSCNNSDVEGNPPVRSSLSADAEEFYPASYNAVQIRSAQGRLLKYKSNSETNGICSNETEEHVAISEKLQQIINILIDDPGQFDHLLEQFVNILKPYFNDVSILGDTAKLIFTEAVAERNFRYSAARLCRILEEQCPFFRSAIKLIAEKQIHDIPNNCDLALTLAELFAQSNCDNLYGNFVVQSIEKIVSLGTIDNIKCVCQVLKLTGALLDIHHTDKMNSIFNQLEVVKPSLLAITHLINSVIALRASNWGQIDSSNSPDVSVDRYSNNVDGPIFYGPDGKELSEEEKQFLSESCVEFLHEDFLDSDPDELFDPDNEMDEEVHAAFLEFTRANRE